VASSGQRLEIVRCERAAKVRADSVINRNNLGCLRVSARLLGAQGPRLARNKTLSRSAPPADRQADGGPS
jgi:hypothetical protein